MSAEDENQSSDLELLELKNHEKKPKEEPKPEPAPRENDLETV